MYFGSFDCRNKHEIKGNHGPIASVVVTRCGFFGDFGLDLACPVVREAGKHFIAPRKRLLCPCSGYAN